MFSRYINRKYGDPISVFATGDGGGVLLSSSGFNSLQMHMKPDEALAIAAELTACVEWMRAQSAILTPELDAIDRVAARRAMREAMPDPLQGEPA